MIKPTIQPPSTSQVCKKPTPNKIRGWIFVQIRYNCERGHVAQLVRAPPCHGGGREFESRRVRHFYSIPILGLFFYSIGAIIYPNMAIKVSRKDQGEANENIIRRFNRKVLQSGVMPLKKEQMRFSKPISKRERRWKAILREQRKAEKAERIKLGLK